MLPQSAAIIFSMLIDDTMAAAWPVSFAIVTNAGELRIPSG
jgi:hypothetical protein